MKIKSLLALSSILMTFGLSKAQEKPAYIIYDIDGNKVAYSKMMKSFKKSDVVLFGEYHNNAISHWLELEVTKDLSTDYHLTLGAEMIESDNQEALNLYLSDSIDQKGLDTLARLWNNHKTDYKPLVDFAKDSGLRFIAANVPRRYARMVARGGFEALDTLTSEEKSWIAPSPVLFDADLPTYQRMLTMMGEHGSPAIVKAQALKDATMAHFILQNLEVDKKGSVVKNAKFIHYNGAYHSDYHEGIGWYLMQHNKKLKVSTITTVSVKDPNVFEKEHIGKADYIICVDEDMTSTY